MLNRREFLAVTGAAAVALPGCVNLPKPPPAVRVNDIHSQLNPTWVQQIVPVDSQQAVQSVVRRAAEAGKPISIAGGRHAMGGQQFGTDNLLVDTRRLDRVLHFDRERGLVEVEAGIQWRALVEHLLEVQHGEPRQWSIAQKQTGADRLSLGGAVSANIHSRGLRMKPFIGDIESLTVIDGNGEMRVCNHNENADLFRLVVGGYGLFGFVYSVTLRLVPRTKVERIVEIVDVGEFVGACERRISEGFVFGDLQYATDSTSPDFLKRGVFSCYRPVDLSTPIREEQRKLSQSDWKKLVYLAHADKARAYQIYSDYYLTTTGQVYWSDLHQLAAYVDDYHHALDRWMSSRAPGTEMITEIYVPRTALGEFMAEAATDLRRHNADVIYGTIRLIERDDETFLAWAREPWVCVIFNLHVEHTPQGLVRAMEAFRGLIDLGIRHKGSYYLTYHKWAAPEQVLACYPQFPAFLGLKRKYDPEGRFQSDWYRHYSSLIDAL